MQTSDNKSPRSEAINNRTSSVSVQVPDKNGETEDVVLGFDTLADYVARNSPYLGSTMGRCVNRIGRATFRIDGETFTLAKNAGEDHLHGGLKGFDKVRLMPVMDLEM
ncbi:Aldose 1-epimerase [Eumeta japonica]|uniref:Galactose mutarotase n=1 Tax=Eumeta variegata TaxID=151549 RepID=A0A4C1TIW9_EUMVA|nr:Aldose 1-epimerase [Eumeta japonica]